MIANTRCGLLMRGLLILSTGILAAGASCPGVCSSNLLTVGLKLGVEVKIGDLDACDWKTLFLNAPALVQYFGVDTQGQTIPQLTDDQAAAIVTFLDNKSIVTLQQLIDAYNSGAIKQSDIPSALFTLIQ